MTVLIANVPAAVIGSPVRLAFTCSRGKSDWRDRSYTARQCIRVMLSTQECRSCLSVRAKHWT